MSIIEQAQQSTIASLAQPGDWLTGAQRIDAWRQVRDAATNELDRARAEALSPYSVDGTHEATDQLDAAAVEVVHRVATDPGRLTPAWAERQLDALGEETYTELVGITAIAMVVDRFARAMGRPEVELVDPEPGEPARQRPDDVGDVGAWVSQSTGATRANVSRTLSLVPVTNETWRLLVDSHYSRGAEFYDLGWDRPLGRPQAELLAARTTALNQCFY